MNYKTTIPMPNEINTNPELLDKLNQYVTSDANWYSLPSPIITYNYELPHQDDKSSALYWHTPMSPTFEIPRSNITWSLGPMNVSLPNGEHSVNGNKVLINGNDITVLPKEPLETGIDYLKIARELIEG